VCSTLQGCINVLEDRESISLNQIHENLAASQHIIQFSTETKELLLTAAYITEK
jgi:hypothetical protein